MKNAGWKPALRNAARTMGTRRSPPLKTKSPDWSRGAISYSANSTRIILHLSR
jgi:hypothetical protein